MNLAFVPVIFYVTHYTRIMLQYTHTSTTIRTMEEACIKSILPGVSTTGWSRTNESSEY